MPLHLITLPHDVLANVTASLWRRDVSSLRIAHRAFCGLKLPGLCPSSMGELCDMLATAEEGALIDLGGRTLGGTLDKPLVIAAPRVTLRDGTLHVSRDVVIKGHGACLEALTVSEGECEGPKKYLLLNIVDGAQGVALKGCTLLVLGVLVVGGATVEMSLCMVLGSGYGCYVADAGSFLVMRECKVHNVQYGVWVHGGAVVSLVACDVSSRSILAIVYGEGSVLKHVDSNLDSGNMCEARGGKVVAV